ncbi:MAG: YqiA/YcfP family alpha/beta fold hydrolase [Candidatus Levyibacteriota bacterium]
MPTTPTIVYLHGFRSSPRSVKATLLAQAVAALPAELRPALHIPQLPHRPAHAMATIFAIVASVDPAQLCLVGSSLGGFYATCAAERHGARAVLINPAVRPWDDLRDHAGMQTNMHTGEAFEVTAAHFAELRAMAVGRIRSPSRYLLLVQTGDEVLDWRQAIDFYAGGWQSVQGGGDHAFSGFEAQIPAILRFCALQRD